MSLNGPWRLYAFLGLYIGKSSTIERRTNRMTAQQAPEPPTPSFRDTLMKWTPLVTGLLPIWAAIIAVISSVIAGIVGLYQYVDTQRTAQLAKLLEAQRPYLE